MLKKPTSRIVGAASKTKNTNAERKPQAAPGVAVFFSPHHSPFSSQGFSGKFLKRFCNHANQKNRPFGLLWFVKSPKTITP